MTTLFDTHVIVDWSARSRPSPAKPCKDAIWYAVVRDGKPQPPRYCRTRHQALHELANLLADELAQTRRVLVGFDFPFGYPAGVAKRICDSDRALDLWDWFVNVVQDAPDNHSNRFDVAAQINRLYDGIGPFWGRPASWDVPDVPTLAKTRFGTDHPPEHRLADSNAKGAKTVWQLAYAGSVGSQVILGLPALRRLQNDPRLAGQTEVWPFQTGLVCPDSNIVLAEIYPSLLQTQAHALKEENEVLDSAQVRVNAQTFSHLDRTAKLAPLFSGAPHLSTEDRSIIEREEAWILGVGHETTLQTACAEAYA